MLASATLVSLVGLAWAAPGCKSATEEADATKEGWLGSDDLYFLS